MVNGNGYVSDDMRERVRKAMQLLNYVPNELARNLYHNRTNLVGVIVPTIRHPFFATFTAHLQHALAAQGLRTMLCSTADEADGEIQYVDMLRRHMMDGIVMAAHTEHPGGYWTSIHRPIVAFDRTLGEGVPAVRSDHEQGGRLIARQLIDSGARHVVLVGGPRSQFAEATTFPTIRYHLTVERMLADAGIACDYVEAGIVADICAHEATARAIFERYSDVDAIVGSDLVASVALQEALRRGISVPRDLQIIAYDGTFMAETAGMRLTAVRQDFPAVAAALASRMDSQIAADNGTTSAAAAEGGNAVAANGGQSTSEDIISVTLIPGETTR